MPRNGSGTYNLPETPFTPNTTISSAAVNSNNDDIADGLTDSLSRTGLGGMQSVLALATAGFSYSADADTGMSRTAANTQVITVGGVNYTITTTDILNPDGMSILPMVGEIKMWASPAAPTGWIFMRGQACTTTYPLWRALLIASGNPYGVSGSDPLFPNLQCAVPVGLDVTGRGLLTGSTALGNFIGQQTNTLVTANLPPYTPAGTVPTVNPPHVHGIGNPGSSFLAGVPSGGVGTISGAAFNIGAQTDTNAATTAVTASFSGTPQGGTSSPLSIVQPTIVINFIGRAA